MSRIGKQPISLPAGVQVQVADSIVTVTGPKGTLTQEVHSCVSLEIAEGSVTVSVARPEHRVDRAQWGLVRSLIQNMVQGVTEGFKKSLEIHGVGYKFEIQ